MLCACVQAGDGYALLVYYYVQQHDYAAARQLVSAMTARGVHAELFVEAPVLEMIASNAGWVACTQFDAYCWRH